MESEKILRFQDELAAPDPMFEYTDYLRGSLQPIVIDNGSYKCRAGWASDEQPRMAFRNHLAKIRAKKSQETGILIGNDITNIELVRSQLKSAFDRNVVTQYDTQEQILDHIFHHLSIDTEEHVAHPLVVTEPVLNPGYCREKMSELLFECYHVPSVAYGIDALFSLYANLSETCIDYCNTPPRTLDSDALVISFGYHTTHVLPVIGGRLQHEACRRVNVGGSTVDAFLLRTLQLKYPRHQAAVNLSRAEELIQRLCRVAVDYDTELLRWMDEEYYGSNVFKIQLPYTQLAAASVSAEQQKERREQSARRLRDMNIKRRQEKLALEQVRLQHLITTQERLQEEEEEDDDDDDEARTKLLEEIGLTSAEELQQAIVNLSASIQKMKDKLQISDAESSRPTVSEEIPGSEESAAAGSKRSRPTKSDPSVKRVKVDSKLDVGKVPAENDKPAMDAWLGKLNKQRTEILTGQTERRQRRSEMTKRRTHASQNRMKILTELAETNTGAKKKKVPTATLR